MMKLIIITILCTCVLGFGGWYEVDVHQEDILKAADYGTKTLGYQLNTPFHIKLEHIHKAKQQVVAGMNYRLDITVGLTTCKKDEVKYEEIHQCEFQDGDNTYRKCELLLFRNLKGDYKLTKFDCFEKKNEGTPKKITFHKERMMFYDFAMKYNKEYKSEEEREARFRVFQRNLRKINYLNDFERGTAKYGVTAFADLTETEFKKYRLGLRPDLAPENDVMPIAEIPVDPIPQSFDWREKDVVSEVKDQGQCGSCWAFSTTGNIEGQWAIKKKKLVSLSEQELVDCDKVDEGCNGGLPSNAYKEIIRLGGLEGEKDYPYEGTDDKCEFNKTDVRVYINSSVAISQNETEMAAWLVKNGPISIGINANAMQFYFGGISHPWKFLCSPDNLDHGVLIVGYGVHTYPLFKTTLPFWIIKNSWGASWGEQGYYRVYRGDGTCGLNKMATSSVIN
uniref:U88-Liphistoxin-Lth1a_1 n=1 Tax=Liphistius thaleban TaxID=1905330 RepID=A0A4V2H8R1_9ARAC